MVLKPALAIMCVTLLAWQEAAYSADSANRPVSQDSYVLVFQEHPRFEVLHKRNRTKDEILSDVYSVSLPTESVVDAIVELGLTFPSEAIPWKKLLGLADRPDTPKSVATWATIASGKALCCFPRPRDVERWLLQQMSGGRNAEPAIVVLGVSRIAGHVTLREWARMLRDPETPDSTCRCIGKYAVIWGVVFEGGDFDEAVNCLLAGYNEGSSSQGRKQLYWETLSLIPDAVISRGGVEDSTLRSLHDLALREFANESNPEAIRAVATTGMKRGETISKEAVTAAKKIQDGTETGSQLRSAADHVIRSAEKYGVDK